MDSCAYTKIKPEDDFESVAYTGKPVMAKYPANKTASARRPVKRSSCLKTCLVVTLAVLGVMVGLTLATGVYVYMRISGLVSQYTVANPMADMPNAVVVTEEDLTVFKDEAKLFFHNIQQAGSTPQKFTASATNLNGLVSASNFLRGNAYAHLETNEVTLDFSLPMDGFPGGNGRYLLAKETLVWDPESSELHTKMNIILEEEKETTLYDAKFHLGHTTDGSDRWNLMLLDFYMAPLDWTAPRDFIDEDRNLLNYLYDANCDDEDDVEACEHARNVLHSFNKILLNEDEIMFQAGHDNVEHRVLTESDKLSSNKLGWKYFARRLVGF